MTSSLEVMVSCFVVPLRMTISLIPVLILEVLILIVSVLILIKPWWSEIIVQTIAKQITVTLRLVRITTLIGSRRIYVLGLANDGWTIIVRMRTTTSFTEEEVIELDDSLRWLKWKVFSKKHFCHLLKCVNRIPWQTIKPSGGMMCQGLRKEIQTKGVIGDPIHFDALGDMQEFVKMLVRIVTRKSMKLARILNLLNHVILKSKVRCLNSNWGNSSTLTIQSWLAQFLHSPKVENWWITVSFSGHFKIVQESRSTRDLLRIVSSGLLRGGKRFLADERVLMHKNKKRNYTNFLDFSTIDS
nr:hypothetical protein [Tanacetum cinerariifolium]